MRAETQEELESWISGIKGKQFQDGDYTYQISLKLDSIFSEANAVGITVFILNVPDVIGPDLLKYALARIIDAGEDSIKRMDCKWFLAIVKVIDLPDLGDISKELFDTTDFLPFNEFSYDILQNKKSFNLGHLVQTKESKVRKMSKFLDYIVSTYTLPEDIQLENREHKLTHKIQSTIFNSPDGPGVKMNISITLFLKDKTPFVHGANSWKLYSDIQKSLSTDLSDKIYSMTPVNITKNDSIRFNTSQLR